MYVQYLIHINIFMLYTHTYIYVNVYIEASSLVMYYVTHMYIYLLIIHIYFEAEI